MSRWIEVATIYEIPNDTVHVVDVDIHDDGTIIEIALFRVDGQIYAIEDKCTHADASLSYGHVEGTTVYCPLHGAQFCLKTGHALTPPAYTPTRSFPIRLRDEFVDVFVSF